MKKKVDYSAFPKICKALRRWPDRVIGKKENPYLLRWHLIPRNAIFNIYLHKFMRSDDDRALHDHPWSWNISLILRGEYIEHVPKYPERFGYSLALEGDFTTKQILRKAWRPIFRRGVTPHRVELHSGMFLTGNEEALGTSGVTMAPPQPLKGMMEFRELPVWTIFITGRHVREWGFYCPHGWRWHKIFNVEREGGNEVGRGCE